MHMIRVFEMISHTLLIQVQHHPMEEKVWAEPFVAGKHCESNPISHLNINMGDGTCYPGKDVFKQKTETTKFISRTVDQDEWGSIFIVKKYAHVLGFTWNKKYTLTMEKEFYKYAPL